MPAQGIAHSALLLAAFLQVIRMRRIASLVALLGLGAPLLAWSAPETVDNFRLTDQQGASHEL